MDRVTAPAVTRGPLRISPRGRIVDGATWRARAEAMAVYGRPLAELDPHATVVAFLRDRSIPIPKPPRGYAAYVDDVRQIREQRTRPYPAAVPPLHVRLRARREDSIRRAILRHYRIASSRWAGGENSIFIDASFIDASVSSTQSKVWSANGKWSGTNLDVTITCPPEALARAYHAAPGYVWASRVILDAVPIGSLDLQPPPPRGWSGCRLVLLLDQGAALDSFRIVRAWIGVDRTGAEKWRAAESCA